MQDQTGKINNLTGKYLMELSKLKHVQRSMNTFELNYRRLERQPQIQQLSLIFTHKIEEIIETLKTADIHSMVKHIFNSNIVNTFQHQNGSNQRQHT